MKRLLVTLSLVVGVHAKASPILPSAITGGTAKAENVAPLSLLQVQKSSASKTSEKLTIKLGDRNGVALSETSFYHIAIDEGGTRMVLDLSQVQQTSVDQSDLRALIKQSNLIRDVEITMDPVDKSTNLTFRMKRPVVAKASGKELLSIEIQEAN